MTLRFSLSRTAVLAVSIIIATQSVAAAPSKRRAVASGTATAEAVLSGTLVDATTGAPVIQAEVRAPGRGGYTDAAGHFAIRLSTSRNTTLTFSRAGYQTLNANVNITGDTAKTFLITPNPTVKVRTTAGMSIELDAETVEFGYIAPFSGYSKDSKLNLCKGGGGSFTPDRSEMRKITAATPLTDAACCTSGSIPAINVELKSGGTTTGGFADACIGYKVDVIAQDHKTAQPVYIHFSDIAEITFP